MSDTNSPVADAIKKALESKVLPRVETAKEWSITVQDLSAERRYVVKFVLTLNEGAAPIVYETGISYEALSAWPEDIISYVAANIYEKINGYKNDDEFERAVALKDQMDE